LEEIRASAPLSDEFLFSLCETCLHAMDEAEKLADEIDIWEEKEENYGREYKKLEKENARLRTAFEELNRKLHQSMTGPCPWLEHENQTIKRLRAALERLRDCDWVVSLPDRMDAVRKIARQALEGK